MPIAAEQTQATLHQMPCCVDIQHQCSQPHLNDNDNGDVEEEKATTVSECSHWIGSYLLCCVSDRLYYYVHCHSFSLSLSLS
jgi:hypothetical protein